MIQLKSFMTKGDVFCVGGKISMEPLHLYKRGSGSSVFRIGDTTLWFNQDGTFEGTEARLSGLMVPAISAVREAVTAAKENAGLPPEVPYYEVESCGYDEELSSAVSLVRETLETLPAEKQKPFKEALARLLRAQSSPG